MSDIKIARALALIKEGREVAALIEKELHFIVSTLNRCQLKKVA